MSRKAEIQNAYKYLGKEATFIVTIRKGALRGMPAIDEVHKLLTQRKF